MSAALQPPGVAQRCRWCGHVYDPAHGDPARGIAPGTPFDALPDEWRCPDCRAPKGDFAPADAPWPPRSLA